MDKIINTVYETTNYDQFVFLDTNREIDKSRLKVVTQSIAEHGYIGSPIEVNEKMEIIDGQARTMACKDLGVPIPYVVVPGLGVQQCMILNRATRNWKDMDYVKSFAKQGIKSYILLLDLVNRFGHGPQVAVYASKNKRIGGGTGSGGALRNGNFTMSVEEYERGKRTLEKIEPMMGYVKSSAVHTQALTIALCYAVNNPKVDYNRLLETVAQRHLLLKPYTVITDILEDLSEKYNTNLKGGTKRIYLKSAYLEDQYS